MTRDGEFGNKYHAEADGELGSEYKRREKELHERINQATAIQQEHEKQLISIAALPGVSLEPRVVRRGIGHDSLDLKVPTCSDEYCPDPIIIRINTFDEEICLAPGTGERSECHPDYSRIITQLENNHDKVIDHVYEALEASDLIHGSLGDLQDLWRDGTTE